ncbi:MAG TPA: NAD(P)-binding domain-containing protein [Polyangiaceae bacterium]|nr:NAD(P)-binding domain-containing protein [Polyangiaceae bacterium]
MNQASGARSDVARPRRMLLLALIAAVVAAVVVAAWPRARMASPGPLSAPHLRADVQCASCHVDGAGAPVRGSSCIGCHKAHPSIRPAHAALVARGALGCPTCHVAHGAPDPAPVATGAVARVALSACAQCHALSRADDPVRACVGTGAWAGLSVCFEEHQTPTSPLPARGACAREHGAARFVAWEQARAASDPGAARSPRAVNEWALAGSSLGVCGLAIAGVAIGRRSRRARAAPRAIAPAAPTVVRLPHVDAVRCLGCQACVDACPFDVLSVERHVAVVARPDACCGLGACEKACPNGSLTLLEPRRGSPDRLRIDASLESLDRRGVFVAGDLTGVPLIRNAILQGAQVAEHVAASLPPHDRATKGRVDLAVVGAGPAGLSAALRAKELGLACVVLEQSRLAASIRSFPRGKIVHDPPIDMPLEGQLWLRESTKEELVAQWTRIVRTHRIDVREDHRVVAIGREEGRHVVIASTPEGSRPIVAARVLLAIGRRGTPRKLDAVIEPEAVPRVHYALSDARTYAGRRVLVVGLGDSAMEAVIALARQPGSTVTVCYRGEDFTRGRAANVDAVRRLVASRRVRLLLRSHVVRVDARWALVRTPEGIEKVAVDTVLALIGGEPSRALLSAAGLRLVEGG